MASPTNYPAVYIKSGKPDLIAWNVSDATRYEYDGYVWASDRVITIISQTLAQRVTALESVVGPTAFTISKNGSNQIVVTEQATGTSTVVPDNDVVIQQVQDTLAAQLVKGDNVSIVQGVDGKLTISVPTLAGTDPATVQASLMAALQSGNQNTLSVTAATGGKVTLTNLATVNMPDADLLDLGQHTGSILIDKVQGLAAALANAGASTGDTTGFVRFGPASIGDGVSTTIRIVHNLGGEVTRVDVWDPLTNVRFSPSISVPAGMLTTAVDLTFTSAPANKGLRCMIEAAKDAYVPPNPNPEPNPGGETGSYLTNAEINPSAGNTAWTIHTGTGTLVATASNWTATPTNATTQARINLTRVPFAIPTDGTADLITFAVTVTQNTATCGLDFFGPAGYIGTQAGTNGAGTVTADRGSNFSTATMVKPFVVASTAGVPLIVTKFKDLVTTAGTGAPPGTDPTTPIDPTPTPGGTLVGGSSLFGPNYRTVFGKSEFVRAIPSNPPLRTPSDQFQAGREIQAQANQYFAGLNSHSWNLPSYVVDGRDTAKYPKKYVTHRNERGFGSIDPWGKNVQAAITAVPIPSFAIPALPNWIPSNKNADSAMSIYDIATDTMYDLWQAYKDGSGNWSCEWAGVTVGCKNKIGVHDIGSTVASGLWGVPMQVGIAELRAGVINHAVGIEIPLYENVWGANWQPQISWPAKWPDGEGGNTRLTGLAGQRLQLDPTLNIASLNLSRMGAMVAKAAQVYGMIITDKSGSVMIRGENPASFIAQGLPDPWYGDGWLVKGEEWKVMQNFPFDKLRALPVDWGKTLGAPA